MSNDPKSPWDESWERGIALDQGGQGLTWRARRRGDLNYDYVLKVLRDQKNHERRARMAREAVFLRTLDHGGISAWADSNEEAFRDPNTPLFIVTEFVPGGTLNECVRGKGSVPLDLAIRHANALLTTLSYCHARGVIHRDIKPTNVILRNGDPTSPVLIDFGLSFNAADDVDVHTTDENQHLGNRFLILPEYSGTKEDKRNQATDISQVIGVLFFAIFGRNPGPCMDAQNLMPHQRRESQEKLASFSDSTRRELMRVFTNGFQPSFDRRWQSIQAIQDQFRRVQNPEVPDFRSRLDELKTALTNRPDISQGQQFAKAAKIFQSAATNAYSKVVAELAEVATLQNGGVQHEHGATLATVMANRRFGSKNIPAFQLRLAIVGQELVLTSEFPGIKGTNTCHMRIGLFDAEIEAQIVAGAETGLLHAIQWALEADSPNV